MKKTTRMAVASAVVVLVLSMAWIRYWNGAAGGGRITASGTIEATEVEIASQVAGRIEGIHGKEGDAVEAGQVLVELERRELSARLRAAEALVAAVRANLANLEAGSREQEIRKAEAGLGEAAANLERARMDRDRIERLHQDRVASDQEWDRARTAFDVAAAKEREARQHLELLKAGTRRQIVEAARGELARAEAGRDLALAQRDQAILVSPLSATILLRHREPGELATVGGPILTLGDLANLWVMIYVKETDLGRVRLGQPARISVDSHPGKRFAGKVIQISDKAEFTPKTIQTKEERVKLVFAVKVAVADPTGGLKPGMPADVELEKGEEAQ